MIRNGLALAATFLMFLCLPGCGGGEADRDAELRPLVNPEGGAPPSVFSADRSEDPGEPPADDE